MSKALHMVAMENAFRDTLPIIPADSRVLADKVLFRFSICVTLTDSATREPIANAALSLRSSNAKDTLKVVGPTDRTGVTTVILETRESGKRDISAVDPAITATPLTIEIKDAWFEAGFSVTAYNVCHEDDFSGALVAGTGLSNRHKEDFLFSARGVPMQGTGQTSSGHYVRLASSNVVWARVRGNRHHVENPTAIRFSYATGVLGRYGQLTDNRSIAVDPKVIPPRSRVSITSENGTRVLGEKTADDVGSAIRGHHVDNFVGTGQQPISLWRANGGNLTNARIKFLG